ncbi:MAG TPA: hypothetical protein VJA28_01755 [Patescibacteria group bacterium]|nr:hypothetical protein [Patescibacteria group bacterium]
MMIEKCDKCGRIITGNQWLKVGIGTHLGGKQFCGSCSRLARKYLEKRGLLAKEAAVGARNPRG